jgi:hypothetical protein
MAVSLILGAVTVRAQDSGALLELLVKKGLITDQEAEDVRADLVKEHAATSAGKLKLSTPITELELYGDARMRCALGRRKRARPTRSTHQATARNAIAFVTGCGSVCAERSWTTGSSD